MKIQKGRRIKNKQGNFAFMAFMFSHSTGSPFSPLSCTKGCMKCKLAQIKAFQNTFFKNQEETLPNQILTQKTTWITFFSELSWGTSQYWPKPFVYQ